VREPVAVPRSLVAEVERRADRAGRSVDDEWSRAAARGLLDRLAEDLAPWLDTPPDMPAPPGSAGGTGSLLKAGCTAERSLLPLGPDVGLRGRGDR